MGGQVTDMPHVTALARTLRRHHHTRVWDVMSSVSNGTTDNEMWLTTSTLEAAHVAVALASDTVEQAHDILGICLDRRPVKVHVELTVTDTGRPETVTVEASWRHRGLIWEVRA